MMRWSAADDRQLREIYPREPWDVLLQRLGRSRNAITKRAIYLGVKREAPRRWGRVSEHPAGTREYYRDWMAHRSRDPMWLEQRRQACRDWSRYKRRRKTKEPVNG